MSSERVVVVGAGVCGLVAARCAQQAGHRVTVVEAAPQVGGQVRSATLGDEVVDLGAEAVPLRAPGVADLVAELGLAESMIHPSPGRTLLSSRRGIIDMPAGVTPVGPTKLLPTVRSRILAPRGLLRAGMEPLLARGVDEDISVGQFIDSRFGPEVGRAVVDPLLGAIHAADLDRFSLASAAPALVRTAREGQSLVVDTLRRSLRSSWSRLRHRSSTEPQAGGPRTPSMATWPQGLVALPQALAADLDVRTDTPAAALARRGNTWRVVTADEDLDAATVILATPTRVAADLLAPTSPGPASVLAGARAVTVATLVVRCPAPDHPVSDAQTWFIGSSWSPLVRQVTNLSAKWPQRHPGAGSGTVLRITLGRDSGTGVDDLDDDALTDAALAELSRLGLDVDPTEHLVSRWHRSMPQPAPGHRTRMDELATGLRGQPGLVVGGAGVDGAGVGTAVVAGRRLARQIRS